MLIALSTTKPNVRLNSRRLEHGIRRSLIDQSRSNATQVMSNPANGSTQNNSIIFFPEATASWGTITYFGLYNAATGGNLVLYGALTNPISIAANYVPLFRVGNFSLTLS